MAKAEEPVKKMKVGQRSVGAVLPPNLDEIEKARKRSDDILERTSCGGGRGDITGGRDSSMQGARREAMQDREAREELSATAVIEGRNRTKKISGEKPRSKSPPIKAREVAREGLATATATAIAAVVNAEGSHINGGGGSKRKRISSCSRTAPPSKIVKRKAGRNPDNMDNKVSSTYFYWYC